MKSIIEKYLFFYSQIIQSCFNFSIRFPLQILQNLRSTLVYLSFFEKIELDSIASMSENFSRRGWRSAAGVDLPCCSGDALPAG